MFRENKDQGREVENKDQGRREAGGTQNNHESKEHTKADADVIKVE